MIVKNYGVFINSFPWDYFCTFTTRYPLSMNAARKAMARLHSSLKSNYGCCQLFWTAEPFDSNYGYHIHALIKFSELQSRNMEPLIKKSWQVVSKGRGQKEYNNTTIKPYDSTMGGNYYVAKYLSRDNADYDILL
jgi:hypothetical protein